MLGTTRLVATAAIKGSTISEVICDTKQAAMVLVGVILGGAVELGAAFVLQDRLHHFCSYKFAS